MAKSQQNAHKKSKQDRINEVEFLRVVIPRHEEIRERIAQCREESRFSAEPNCLLIMGHSGVGKSTIIEHYSREHPRKEDGETTVIPVLYSRILSPGTIGSIATGILKSLGDPNPVSGTITNKTYRITNLLIDCMVELLIIDEFQEVLEQNSNNHTLKVSNWLKGIINETRIPIVLVGLPASTGILNINEQLSSRFSCWETIDPLEWSDDADIDELRYFLSSLDDALPFPKRSHLADYSIAFRLFIASSGLLRPLMNVIRTAAKNAIKRDCEQIDAELLAKAYDEKLASSRIGPNPFRCDLEELRKLVVSKCSSS